MGRKKLQKIWAPKKITLISIPIVSFNLKFEPLFFQPRFRFKFSCEPTPSPKSHHMSPNSQKIFKVMGKLLARPIYDIGDPLS